VRSMALRAYLFVENVLNRVVAS